MLKVRIPEELGSLETPVETNVNPASSDLPGLTGSPNAHPTEDLESDSEAIAGTDLGQEWTNFQTGVP